MSEIFDTALCFIIEAFRGSGDIVQVRDLEMGGEGGDLRFAGDAQGRQLAVAANEVRAYWVAACQGSSRGT